MRELRALELIRLHKTVFLDAYGVLVTSSGALPGAATLIDELNRAGTSYAIVTNDASRLPEVAAAYYQKCGLEIPVARVFTAGRAVAPRLAQLGRTLRCIVLGTADTRAYVERAGHEVVGFDDDCDAILVGDDSGFDFLPTVNAVLSVAHRLVLKGRPPLLLLINSDLIYPRGGGAYGFTSGAISRLLESALEQLHPDLSPRFETIGKPSLSFFEAVLRSTSTSAADAVMVGDQLHTDILGANATGIASAFVMTGALPREIPPDRRPTYLLRGLG